MTLPSRHEPHRQAARFSRRRYRFALLGTVLVLAGFCGYMAGVLLSIVRLVTQGGPEFTHWVFLLIWYSGMPTTLGIALVAVDLFTFLPRKRVRVRRIDACSPIPQRLTVAVACYNEAEAIALVVKDFLDHPMVEKVIVVDNNSSDGSARLAEEAGAAVHVEMSPGYGPCVYRCLAELRKASTEVVVLCEGDMTFRAHDLQKLAAYAPHADIVNGTRIVEQLRAYDTQLSTFMYYGNFFVAKLLEIKHLGKGTFTDVGTTYKLLRREMLDDLLANVSPDINLSFNAHFLDRALTLGYLIVECPITFHRRVGASKGGNVNNLRALKVGMAMILGLLSDWRIGRV